MTALEEADATGLGHDEVGASIQKWLGFDSTHLDLRVEWLSNPELEGGALTDAERAMRDVLAHRFWADQQRTWRTRTLP